jgi:hypothetical protein
MSYPIEVKPIEAMQKLLKGQGVQVTDKQLAHALCVALREMTDLQSLELEWSGPSIQYKRLREWALWYVSLYIGHYKLPDELAQQIEESAGEELGRWGGRSYELAEGPTPRRPDVKRRQRKPS